MLDNTSVRRGLEVKVMARENSFDDIGLEDARRRLQGVSEYMDELIKRRRCSCKITGDDVLEDQQWNLAHDVLEIIHCLEVDKPSSVGSLAVEIEVDTRKLDEAIGKAERLAELISENMFDPVEFYGWSKQDLILVLVNNYAWSYIDACNFAESYWDRR